MGAKIITEKDFWMCSSGAMPAQLQGTRTSNKKNSGEVYITLADTATSSWIDFGCTKNMLFAALIAAVVVVVVVALVVGTGGIAAIGLLGMMAIGAGAGVVGGVVAAVDGALKCGQKNAPQRSWSNSKQNLILTGVPAITGAHTMTCKVGGTVTFAPEVKSWTHAIALGGLNYLTKFAECGLAGAAVGGGGYLFAGLASGSIALAWPSVPSVVANVTGSFTGVWGASRVLFGLDNLANEQAYGHVQDGGDVLSAAGGGAIPEVGMAKRIFTGQAQPADYLLFLYLLNVKAGRNAPPVEERPATNGNEEGNPADKDGNNTPEEENNPAAQSEAGEPQNNEATGRNGEAFEDPSSAQVETPPENIEVPPEKMTGKRPSNPEYPVLDANGNLTEYGKWYYERPTWRKKTVDDVWERAKNDDGKVIDRLSRDEITWDKTQPRGEQWHMGHDYGYEFAKHQQSAAERGIGIDQYRNEYNTPDHVSPELPSSNVSHAGEAGADEYFGF